MIQIAIDGPSGAGKSTIARDVAQRLGYVYIDTGAMYRTVALYAVQNEVDPMNEEGVVALLDRIAIDIRCDDDKTQHIYLDGQNVDTAIRSPEMSAGASAVSAYETVREKLVQMQRELAMRQNVVMDGRDIGTCVLPDAKIKLFLSADVEDRAQRRYDEMVQKGLSADYQIVLADMKQRDYNDSHRKFSPLRQAENAIFLDTTNFPLEKSKELVYNTIVTRLEAEGGC